MGLPKLYNLYNERKGEKKKTTTTTAKGPFFFFFFKNTPQNFPDFCRCKHFQKMIQLVSFVISTYFSSKYEWSASSMVLNKGGDDSLYLCIKITLHIYQSRNVNVFPL